MRLETVSINNYRGLRDFTITLSDRTVLVGGSNTCKTTLLEAINLVLYPGFYYGPGLLSEYDFYNRQYEQPEDQISINLKFVDLTPDELLYFGDHLEPIHQDGSIVDAAHDTDVFDRAPKILRIHFASTFQDDEILCGVHYTRQGDEEHVSKRDRAKIGFQYVNLHRALERVFSLGGTSAMQRTMRQENIDLRQQQRRILERFPDIADVLLENPDFKTLLGNLESKFRDFTYLADVQADVPTVKYEISDLSFSEINRSIQMFVHTANSAQALPLTHQGSGTRNALVLALLVHLSELQGNAILAIDEPELSLHAHAQRYLMEKIKGARSQLILATHSPAVAESFDLTEIRLLQHRDNRLQVFSIDDRAVAAAPANTLPILKRKLVEAYFSRAILLVEGDTEEGTLLAFNTSLRQTGRGLDLHKQELTLFNLQGYRGIGQLLDALRPLPVRKILLIDNDKEESFYDGLRPKVDLLIRTPKTPAGDDFEGMIGWQSRLETLGGAVQLQMQNSKHAKQLPRSFKQRVRELKENGQGNSVFLQRLLELDQTPSYFESACPILADWESAYSEEKPVIRSLYAEVFREFKGFRSAFEWGALYSADQLPAAVVELFDKIRNLLGDEMVPGTQHVLTQ